MRRRPDDGDQRVSPVELFFDLVFVLVVSQLSSLLADDLTLSGAGETLFLLLVAWWAWVYTTWTTNWFDPDSGVIRAILLVGMLASLLGALSIPDAFGERAYLLVGGYVGVQLVRNAVVVIATARDDPLHTPLVRVLAWSAWVSLIWIAGALADDDTRLAIWIAALALDYLGPAAGHWTPGLGRSHPRDWELVPSHFIERIKLFVIIALGEAIVATGRTASELEPTTARIIGVVLAFWVTAAFWWLYFDYHAERALEELSERRNERGRVGRDLTYVHIPMIAGIIVTAVANEIVIAHPDAHLHGRELLVVAGGPVLYLLGSLAFKVRVLRMFSVWRVAATLLVAAAAALGTVLPALVTWSVVVAVLTALAVSERFGVARGTPLTRSATAERRAIG